MGGFLKKMEKPAKYCIFAGYLVVQMARIHYSKRIKDRHFFVYYILLKGVKV